MNTKTVIIVFIMIFSASLYSQTNNFQGSTDKSEKTLSDTLKSLNRKSPTTAFLLSLAGGVTLLPGLGQHYNGEHKKGFLMGAAWYSGMIILFSTESRDTETTGQIIGLPLVLGSIIWSCIDAPLSANKINRKAQHKFSHMLEFSNERFIVGVDININDKTLRQVITVYF